jgi:hypothetical protein
VITVLGVVATSALTLPSGRPNLHSCSAAFAALQQLHGGGYLCTALMSVLLMVMMSMVMVLPCHRNAAAVEARWRRMPVRPVRRGGVGEMMSVGVC